MKKLFLMLAFLGSVVITAFAENKPKPKEEPYVYTFCGHCETLSITKSFDHQLSDEEIAYWNGYVDGLCNPNLHYC